MTFLVFHCCNTYLNSTHCSGFNCVKCFQALGEIMANFKTSYKILSNDTQVKEETQQLGQGGGAEDK